MSNTPGLLTSLRGFAASSVALLRTRLELFRLEAREEVGRIAGMLAWTVAAVLLAVLGLGFLAIFLTVLFWESHRLLALGLAAAIFLAAAALALNFARNLALRGTKLFAASLAELRKDEAALAPEPPRDRPT